MRHNRQPHLSSHFTVVATIVVIFEHYFMLKKGTKEQSEMGESCNVLTKKNGKNSQIKFLMKSS